MYWRFSAAQATGSAHDKLGKPCQDRFACKLVDEEFAIVAVVADGAGSAEHAHLGAEIAVTTVGDIAALGVRAGRRDYQQILRDAAAIARQRLVEAAADRQLAPRDLACTLLAAILVPLGGAALQIGDGAIVTAAQPGDWRCVFWPQKGEYANATFFLSDEQALTQAETVDLDDDVFDLAMFSDGMEPLALHYASRSAHAPFFRTVFAPLQARDARGDVADLSQAMGQMLASPAVRARTDDDTTLVLATRRPVAGS